MHLLFKKLKARLPLNSVTVAKIIIVLLCVFVVMTVLDKLALITLSDKAYIAIATTALMSVVLMYLRTNSTWLAVVDNDIHSGIPLLTLNNQGHILASNTQAQAIFNHTDINHQPLDALLTLQQFTPSGTQRINWATLKQLHHSSALNHSRISYKKVNYQPILVALELGHFLLALISIEREARLASELEAEKELLEVTLSSIGDGVICTDTEGKITYINPVSEAILARLNEEVVGKPFDEVMAMYNEESKALISDFPRLCLEKGHTICLPELTSITNHLGLTFAIQDSFSPIFAKDGGFLGTVMVFQDVTESRIMAKKLSHLAHHDPLTGLPNRLLLQDRLVQACKRGKRAGHQFALIFLDINKFKKINDTFGHDYGDLLLKEVASRLTDKLRACDTVARMGGDEFVLLIDSIKDKRHVRKVVSKVLERVNGQYTLQQVNLKATVSAGIALYPDDGQDTEALLKHADTAMYRAKKSQQHAWQFYNAELVQTSEQHTLQEQALRVAVEQNEFIPYFQPVLDAYNRKVVKLEVLARWQQPNQLNSASRFMAMAEQTALINEIGSQVRAKALECAKEWLQQHNNLIITFNLSLAELLDSQCQSDFCDLLQHHQIAANQVEIEIQERDLITLLDKSATQLKKWQTSGVKIAIDHFGVAAASMDYLSCLIVDTIKISPLFLAQQQDHDNDLPKLIASMAKSLNVECVAVGVESELQAKSLCFKGCHMLQGEHLFAPMSAAETEQLLATNTVVAKRKHLN